MSAPISPSSTETLPTGTSRKPRMLIVCFDGTTNKYGPTNTNVVKFFAMLKKNCDDEQLCYYQAGVGTYESPRFLPGSLSMLIAKLVDMAIAWYLNAHVMGGYRFLMDNYRNGDKISIFGFSRGAYTARALAGMLATVGLLPKDNIAQVPFAWKMYAETGFGLAEGFKKAFCRTVKIEFLGVWETVASTGAFYDPGLPFTTNNVMIKTFRHALALDERRAKFVPSFYHIPAPRLTPSTPMNGGATTANPQPEALLEAAKKAPKSILLQLLKRTSSESSADNDAEAESDVKEVWFVGGHSDVGGGVLFAENSYTSLADIPLRWMIREVIASDCGIQFDSFVMEKLNVHSMIPPEEYFSAALSAANASATKEQGKSSEEQAKPSARDEASDHVDAMKPLHDDLVRFPAFWILEFIPFVFSWQDRFGAWHSKWEMHLGRGRYKNDTDPLLFHETVRIRMADASLKYTPKLKYTPGEEKYVW